jgi:PAS domain S-box-containing protein
MLFVILILSFLGFNHFLVTSTVSKTEAVYNSSEWVRQEMETENVFWRQVIAMTDYFLTGEQEYITEFHKYQNVVRIQMATLQASARSDAEKQLLEQLRKRYEGFLAKFDKAAALYEQGRKEEAIQVDLNEIDPLEEQVEQAWEEALKLRKADIDSTLSQIKSYRKFARISPSFSTMIDSAEAIQNESEALQHSLEAEEYFLKQTVALTDLFAFNEKEHIDEFHELSEVFQRELRQGQLFAKTAEENQQLALIDANHRAFTDAFGEAARIYESGDRVRALRMEMEKVDPAEDQLGQALKQFYPLKQQDMKRSLDNVLLINNTTISITRSLAVWVSLILLLGLAIGAVVAIRITGPAKELAEATRRIAAGDFSTRSEVKSGDEIGQLARSFNSMVENLQRTTVSKDYVNGIIKSMGDSLVVASADGSIVVVNAATCSMLGYTEAELIGQPLKMLFGAEAGFLDHSGALTNLESTCLAKNGQLIPVAFSLASMRLESGEVGIVCVAKDITELKRAMEAVRQSEHKLSLHIQQTPLAVIEWNLNAEIVEWNPAAETVFGYSKQEVLGRQLGALLVPEAGRKQAIQEWNQLLAEKVGQHVTHQNLTKDGRTIVCEWYNTPLDSEGRIIGVASMAQDFTERTEMEKELKAARDVAVESARMKSEFLANMSHEIRTPMNGVVGMTGLLLDTQLTADQREFAETIRSSGDTLLTIINDILDFSKIEAGKLQFEVLDFDLSNAIEGTVELLAERAHGKKVELASLICGDVPLALRGDPGRLRQVLTNLVGNGLKFTERGEVIVRAEKESEIDNDVVIRFTVSDTGIGISEKARKRLFQAFTQADGSTSRKYGGTGLGLAISKQLVGLMGGQIGVNSIAGEGSNFWFTARFEKQANQMPNAQPDRPLNGLHALIVDDNATNRKILQHQLSSWEMTHEEADSGARALELLRAAAADSRRYDLAILDLMMPGMDGFELARTIKSDPSISDVDLVLLTSYGQRGDGTTAHEAGISAYLTKPVRQSQLFQCLTGVISQSPDRTDSASADKAAVMVTKHTIAETKRISNKLILLAEDNIVNQKVAVRQLMKLGYRADAVANGLEALEALGRIPYDLVLMDCQMPEMDGYEATAEIRRREGTSKHTPIVAMTAHALDGDRAKCIASGMDDYVSKPVKPEELGRVLEKLLTPVDDNMDTFATPTSEALTP